MFQLQVCIRMQVDLQHVARMYEYVQLYIVHIHSMFRYVTLRENAQKIASDIVRTDDGEKLGHKAHEANFIYFGVNLYTTTADYLLFFFCRLKLKLLLFTAKNFTWSDTIRCRVSMAISSALSIFSWKMSTKVWK